MTNMSIFAPKKASDQEVTGVLLPFKGTEMLLVAVGKSNEGPQ